MHEFIISSRNGRTEVVWADSLHEASKIAILKSFRAGYLTPDEMSEPWAEHWSFDRAYDCNLLPYEIPQWAAQFMSRDWS